MRSLLDAIGIASNDQHVLEQALKQAMRAATRRDTSGQTETRYWQASSGAGLVLRFSSPKWRPAEQIESDPLDGLVGVTPFHAGKSAIEVRLRAGLSLQACDAGIGGIQFDLPSLRNGSRPLTVFAEIAPYVSERWAEERGNVRLQVVVFAAQVAVYEGLADYFLPVSQKRLVAPGAVVPEVPDDLIGSGLRGGDHVRPVTMVGGVIREMRRLTNVLTSQDYLWMLVDSEHGAFDVTVNPAAVHGELGPGKIVQAIGALVARELPLAETSERMETITGRAEPTSRTQNAQPKRASPARALERR